MEALKGEQQGDVLNKNFGKASDPRGKVKITWRPVPSEEGDHMGL